MTIEMIDVIGKIESNGDKYAMRFEPATYAKTASLSKAGQDIISTIQTLEKCSWGTANMIYSTSFGIAQIMGFNLYAQQMQPFFRVGQILNDPVLQATKFNQFLAWQFLGVTVDTLCASAANRLAFALKYNGAATYAQLIAKSLQSLGLTIQV